MELVLNEALKSPVLLGYLAGMVVKALHDYFVKFDHSELATKYGGQLHIVTAVLTFLASATALASKGQLETLDMTQVQNLLQIWVPMFVGAKVAHVDVKK